MSQDADQALTVGIDFKVTGQDKADGAKETIKTTSATNWTVIFRDTSLPAVFPAPANSITNGSFILVPPAGNP